MIRMGGSGSCSPADVCKAILCSFEQPAQVGPPDASRFLLCRTNWIVMTGPMESRDRGQPGRACSSTRIARRRTVCIARWSYRTRKRSRPTGRRSLRCSGAGHTTVSGCQRRRCHGARCSLVGARMVLTDARAVAGWRGRCVYLGIALIKGRVGMPRVYVESKMRQGGKARVSRGPSHVQKVHLWRMARCRGAGCVRVLVSERANKLVANLTRCHSNNPTASSWLQLPS